MKIHNYDTSLDELKDCPFCGSRPIAFLQGNEYINKMGKKVSITIKCPNCRIQRTDAVLRYSLEWLENLAIENWNNQITVENKTAEARADERMKVEVEMGLKCFHEIIKIKHELLAELESWLVDEEESEAPDLDCDDPDCECQQEEPVDYDKAKIRNEVLAELRAKVQEMRGGEDA